MHSATIERKPATWRWHALREGSLVAQNRESHDSQNRTPGIARNSAARSKKWVESQWDRGKSIQNRHPNRILSMRPWNCTIPIARFWIVRFSVQSRRFSATKGGRHFITKILLRHPKIYSLPTPRPWRHNLGNGRNAVSRVLFRKRELTEFCSKLGELCGRKRKSSVSSLFKI